MRTSEIFIRGPLSMGRAVSVGKARKSLRRNMAADQDITWPAFTSDQHVTHEPGTSEWQKQSQATAHPALNARYFSRLIRGNWYLPHPQLAPWVDGFINECAAFPAGVNDDQVDAWSQGAKRLMTVVSKRPQQAPPERHASERSWMSN
jgi:hypothetical protein